MSRDPQSFTGYTSPTTSEPDLFLTQVGRGTPGGEYLRRFWQAVCYVDDLTDVPLKAKVLGEELVVFRDGSGDIGVLHLNCCHRGTSLEFGLIAEKGIRCCYHGRVFDTDGSVLEMPGEPAGEQMRKVIRQGAYPIHIFGGIVFAYMGPPDKCPPFPLLDRFDIPGVKLMPGCRQHFHCNWLQIKENAMDPAHTAVLHAIEGANQFSSEFGQFPELAFGTTPIGMVYAAVRLIGENIWIRSTDVIMPNIHSFSSFLENGTVHKQASPPWLTIWTTPVDDENSINFLLSHVAEDDPMPLEKRRWLENFGQSDDRPYADRQRLPGDYDAMVSQGPINIHSREKLGTLDEGVVLFRRELKRGIEAVQRGEDPPALIQTSAAVATYGTDRVISAAEMTGDPQNSSSRRQFARDIIASYLKEPPVQAISNLAVPADG